MHRAGNPLILAVLGFFVVTSLRVAPENGKSALEGEHEGSTSPSAVQDEVWKNPRTPMIDALEIVGDHDEADGIEALGTMQLIAS